MSRYPRFLSLPMALVLALALVVPAAATGPERATMQRWAADTWASFVAMTDPATGLPSDNIAGDLEEDSRAAYTSPTNIGMYIWATLAARDLRLITPNEAQQRIAVTLDSVGQLERHEPSGQFYNWYNPKTLDLLAVWPEDGSTVYPFLSSVDNGWLASALHMIANGAVPQLREAALELVSSMDFGFYYNPIENQIRGGYWPSAPPTQGVVPAVDSYAACQPAAQHGTEDGFTCHHYGAFNTEPRIASYIGIAYGQIPARHYFGGFRTFEDTCGWNWQETRPIGEWAEYTVEGEVLRVFEGAYPYDDQLVVPTWGGSAFEAFMVPLVVPEEQWGAASWGVTHPLYAESMVEFGLEAQYGYWGHSPSSNPAGGYREYGIDWIGMEPNGYAADVERLTIGTMGWDDPACPVPPEAIRAYGEGVVTPHAAAITLDFAFDAALENLRNLEADFPDLYGPGGFKDAINVETGEIADRYLSLDQGMFLAALTNELRNDRLQHYFSHGAVEQALRPLMAMEEFGAGRIGE
jgi:hypothetical protein